MSSSPSYDLLHLEMDHFTFVDRVTRDVYSNLFDYDQQTSENVDGLTDFFINGVARGEKSYSFMGRDGLPFNIQLKEKDGKFGYEVFSAEAIKANEYALLALQRANNDLRQDFTDNPAWVGQTA